MWDLLATRKKELLLPVGAVVALLPTLGCCIPLHSVVEEGGRTVEIVVPHEVREATPHVFCRVFDEIQSHWGILGNAEVETRTFRSVPLEGLALRTSRQNKWHLGRYFILGSEFRRGWCEYVFYARGAQTGRWTATGAEGTRFRATLLPADSAEEWERAVDEFLGISRYRFYGVADPFRFRDGPVAVPWRENFAEAITFAVQEYRWCAGQSADVGQVERIQSKIDCLLGEPIPFDPRELWPSVAGGLGFDHRDTTYGGASFPDEERKPGYLSGMALERLE